MALGHCTARRPAALWPFGAACTGAQFDQDADFTGAHFDNAVRFDSARFGSGANIDGRVSFVGAQFGDHATFDGTHFIDVALFLVAQFGDRATLDRVRFEKLASFAGTQFGTWETFIDSKFISLVSFAALSEKQAQGQWRDSRIATDGCDDRMKRSDRLGLRSDAFREVIFSGAWLASDVSFQNREFLGRTHFGHIESNIDGVPRWGVRREEVRPARFEGVPDFHGCKLHRDTSFDGAQFLAHDSVRAARAYRTLKLAMAQQQAIREEQVFFRHEMQVEGALATGARRRLFKVYEYLSD